MAVDGKEVKQLHNPGIGGNSNYTFIMMIISHIWDFSSGGLLGPGKGQREKMPGLVPSWRLGGCVGTGDGLGT